MKKKIGFFLLIFFIILLIAINYSFLDSKIENFLTEQEKVNVVRIIDGDTIVVGNNTHVRMLGINTPEKGELYYKEAKDFLNNSIFNRTIRLEYGRDKTDLYDRTLAYVFLDGKNINLEQVRNGFANFYFPSGKDAYYQNFKDAWNECLRNQKNLCEKSNEKCASCIELKNLDVKKQTAIFYNNCSFSCSLTGWNIKDEGRKNFFFPNFTLKNNQQVSVIVGNQTSNETTLFWKGEDYVWTAGGDTLFLRDGNGKLVLWKNY